jgi:pimeloyl-ACP methyl ester carboxylesterase
MTNPRIYGKAPYNIVVVHGGPGAAGTMAPIAKQLSRMHGVIEPFQTKDSVNGQIRELSQIIKGNCELPVILIGWSWGAWLCYLTAARNPSMAKKLILISSGPFEQKYVKEILDTRLHRMSEGDKTRFHRLLSLLETPLSKSKNHAFAELGKLLAKTDSFDSVRSKRETANTRYDIYQSVWREAALLRRTGTLLKRGKDIRCPVVAVHGDFDSHPYRGVEIPLRNVLREFTFVLLKNCGHQPWAERFAGKDFFRELEKELIA